MPSLRSLAAASHLAPTLAMTTGVTGLCWAGGWSIHQLTLGATAVLSGQLSVGWSNDAHDAPVDRQVARRDKPVAAGAVDVRTLWWCAALAGLTAVPLSWWAAGFAGGSSHLVGVAAAWAYNLRLSRTAWSWLPYALAFAAIGPYVTWGATPATPPAGWFLVALALLGVGAHAANALPDLTRDRAAGVGGMAPLLGRERTRLVALAAVIAATAAIVPALAAAAPSTALAAATAAAVTLAVALLRPRDDRAAFVAVMALALVDVMLIIVAGVPLAA